MAWEKIKEDWYENETIEGKSRISKPDMSGRWKVISIPNRVIGGTDMSTEDVWIDGNKSIESVKKIADKKLKDDFKSSNEVYFSKPKYYDEIKDRGFGKYLTTRGIGSTSTSGTGK